MTDCARIVADAFAHPEPLDVGAARHGCPETVRVSPAPSPLCGEVAQAFSGDRKAGSLVGRRLEAAKARCSVAKCRRPARVKGVCLLHYSRVRRGIALDAPLQKRRLAASFVVEPTADGGCGIMECGRKPIAAFGMCWAHYQRDRRGLPVHVLLGGSGKYQHALKCGPKPAPFRERRLELFKHWLATLWTPEPTTGCWLWLGEAMSAAGYARIGNEHDPWGGYAHRAVLYFQGVRFPKRKRASPNVFHVRHLCNQPACVNPAHIALGTAKENARDRSQGPAWQAWLGKLRNGEVPKLSGKLLSNGLTVSRIAARAGLSVKTVQGRVTAGWPVERLGDPITPSALRGWLVRRAPKAGDAP